VYLDEYVSAIQRFDASTAENENGVFSVLGAEWLRFTVKGPFKWPDAERRTVCAFQPTTARCQLGEWEWEWSLEADPSTASLWSTAAAKEDGADGGQAPASPSFENLPVTKLPFFKFLLVDDTVAVAQGRSGGVAIWARTE